MSVFRQRYGQELLPLQNETTALQCRLIQAWDSAHDRKGCTKAEKRKLGRLIVDLAEEILGQEERDDIKELFNKYSAEDFDDLEAAQQAEMKEALEGLLGMELGDDVDMSSPEDVLKRMEAQFRTQQGEWEQQETMRKKSRREEAQIAKREAEEKQLSQSIREVYRKLAAALHPDREPDQAEKERKTALMQRANQPKFLC